MIDSYLRAANQSAMDTALTAAGLLIDQGEDGFVLAPGVCLDRIGAFDRIAGLDEDGEPIIRHRPEYHANLRLLDDFGAMDALADILIAPPNNPFRQWL